MIRWRALLESRASKWTLLIHRMPLRCLRLLIEGGGTWSIDAAFTEKRRPP